MLNPLRASMGRWVGGIVTGIPDSLQAHAGRTDRGRQKAECRRRRPGEATPSHPQAVYKPCAWEGVATLKPSTGGNNDHSCAGCASWTIVALLCQKSSRSSIVGPS